MQVTFACGDESHHIDSGCRTRSASDQHLAIEAKSPGTDYSYKHDNLNWPNIIFLCVLHILGLWGLGILFNGGISFVGFLWGTYVTINMLQLNRFRGEASDFSKIYELKIK